MNSTEAELESFRQKWREEVSAKTKGKQPAPAVPTKTSHASSSRAQASKSSVSEVSTNAWSATEEVDEVQPHVFQNLGEKQHGRRLDETSAQAAAASSKEPKSALEHYEKAVERENQGSLGDSLNLYRKAFKVRTALKLLSYAQTLTYLSSTQESTTNTKQNTSPQASTNPQPQLRT
jgi:F-box protein 9